MSTYESGSDNQTLLAAHVSSLPSLPTVNRMFAGEDVQLIRQRIAHHVHGHGHVHHDPLMDENPNRRRMDSVESAWATDTCRPSQPLLHIRGGGASETPVETTEETPEERRRWRTMHDLLGRASPLALALTLRLLRDGRHGSLSDAFRREWGVAVKCLGDPRSDFREGVLAKLIRKDETPSWHDKHTDDLRAVVDEFLEPISITETTKKERERELDLFPRTERTDGDPYARLPRPPSLFPTPISRL